LAGDAVFEERGDRADDAEIIAAATGRWHYTHDDAEVWWWAQSVHQRAEHRWQTAADHWADTNHIDPAAWLYWQLSRPL
jgi:hypothetical protein